MISTLKIGFKHQGGVNRNAVDRDRLIDAVLDAVTEHLLTAEGTLGDLFTHVVVTDESTGEEYVRDLD